MKVEKVEAANEHVETQKKIAKHTSERKRKIGIETQSVTTTGEDEHAFPPAKDANKDNKRRARDGRNARLIKDVATLEIENTKDKNLNGVKPAVKGNQFNTEESRGNRTSDHQINVGKADMGKGENNGNTRSHFNNSEKGNESHKHLKRIATDERGSKPAKHDECRQKIKMGTLPSEKCYKQKDEVGDGASNQVEVPKNSTVKRKQQREAVDALLSSALISTKKPESFRKSLSVKRTLSTSSGGDQIRPPKPRKDSDH
ncbi:tRNA-splicing endonuclease positive effector (SEN1) [Abeliophyllum distichum]|uniref:tRNA-splicing endonuclease positive effector (SEN1) n=1 Tax=Abeliophyllum distichum TaxID=126358 RepID=A0ABD1VPD5_9LAMI